MNRNELLQAIQVKSNEFDALVKQLKHVLIEKGSIYDSLLTLDSLGQEYEASLLLLESLREELNGLVESYKNLLSNKPFTRCPFTGKQVALSLDTEGIDGLWWNSDNPIRLDMEVPPTFFALDGAMSLSKTLEKSPFPVMPGPDYPFVLPRLLSYDQVKAVISQVDIGEHIGYLITYFCDPFLIYEPRINDWGTPRYWEPNPLAGDFTTPGKWIALDPLKSEMDFNLKNWMSKGKLFWIEPGDDSLRLRVNIETCPFLQLEGTGSYQVIKKGELSFLEEIEPIFSSLEDFHSLISEEELRQINEEIEAEMEADMEAEIEAETERGDI